MEDRLKRWGPFLAIAIFPLLLLWRPLFAGEAFFWGTPLLQFIPWQRLGSELWRAGHLPLWNPFVGCGAPLAANYQTAAFYPLNALGLVLPVEVALNWATALHLALAGWGMFRWIKSLGSGSFPALIGALALEGSGFLVSRAGLFPSVVFTFPWLAIWLWRAEVLTQRRRLRDALWLGLTLGLGLLAGHAQTAFYGGLLLTAYLLFRGAHHPQRFPHLFGLCTLAAVAGLALAAVQLLPTAELMLQSHRATGVGEEFAMTYSLWPWRLITFAAPDFFGAPGAGTYRGYPNYWEGAGYIGLLPLVLALGAVLFRNRQRTKSERAQIWFWATTVVLSILLALGKNTPVFPFLFRYVPTFDLFQAPARWLAIATVGLAVLAAFGAHRWPRGHRGRNLGALSVVIGLGLVVGGLIALRLLPVVPPYFCTATARLGGSLALTGTVFLLRRDRVWWRAGVIGFVLLDLLLFGWPLVPTVDRALYEGQSATGAALTEDPSVERAFWPPEDDRETGYELKFDHYFPFESFGPRDLAFWESIRETQLPNVGMLDGVASANNFDPLRVGHYDRVARATVDSPHLFPVMGVTHLVTATAEAAPPSPAIDVHVRTVNGSPGRAWFVRQAEFVTAEESFKRLLNPDFDPTEKVLIDSSTATEAAGDDTRNGPSLFRAEPSALFAQDEAEESHNSIQEISRNDGSFLSPYKSPFPSINGSQGPSNTEDIASDDIVLKDIVLKNIVLKNIVLQDGPNRVTIHAVVEAPGYLVVADTWYPGWQAWLDGERVDILRANYAFRAVPLEAGEQTVEMVYRPASILWGAGITAGGGSLLIAGLVWSTWQARRKVQISRDKMTEGRI